MVKRNIGLTICLLALYSWFGFNELSAQVSGRLPVVNISENEISIRFHPEDLVLLPDSVFQSYGINIAEIIEAVKNEKWIVFAEAGWKVKNRGRKGIEMSKSLKPVEEMGGFSGDWFYNSLFMSDKQPGIPIMEGVIGYNKWKNQPSVTQSDSLLRFEILGFENAKEVYLSGSFNNWATRELSMNKEDNSWVLSMKLPPGKYLYKFIVDGKWVYDAQNLIKEDDGYNEYNSVLYVSNHVFRYSSTQPLRKVYAAGTFNGWNPKDLRLNQVTENSFELPVYLVNGTYAYKFVADGEWHEDPAASRKVDDNNGGFNSIIEIGTPHLIRLDGFQEAQSVFVSGTFNDWDSRQLALSRANGGWELNYVLAPGNYEYKFIVDDRWMTDPANHLVIEDGSGNKNSLLTIEPNYTFILKDYPNAKSIVLTGSFNDWNEKAYQMQRLNGEWIFHLNLAPGRYTYKFIVDGDWINDPANLLWEENEYGTGNSVLWFNPISPQ